MGRIIDGQTITSTHLDSHGERITREEMFALFNNRPARSPMGDNHNLSRLPVCRSFNDRLEELPDGELAWKVDIEVFDEEAFSKFGGFSIGFTRRHIRFGNGDVEAKLTINTRQFDFEQAAQVVRQVVPRPHVFEVVERIEKADAITVAIIAISTYVALEISGGFFKAIGASLFEAAKKLCRKDVPAAPTEIHYHLHLAPKRVLPIVVLAVDPACELSDVRNVTEESIRKAIQNHVPLQELERAVAAIRPGGEIDLQFVTNQDGEIVYRKNGDA